MPDGTPAPHEEERRFHNRRNRLRRFGKDDLSLTVARWEMLGVPVSIRRTTSALFEEMDHEVVAVSDGPSALKQLDNAQFDLAFLDLKLGAESGLDLLPALLKNTEQLDVVVFTAFASFESAVEAMRRGAVDYIPKPFTPEQIRQVLMRINKTRKLQGRVAELESCFSGSVLGADLTTDDPAIGLRLGGKISLEELANEHIRQVLREASTLEAAAQTLGIDTATLYRKRKKLGL